MDTGFRKELQDVGHEKMINLLITLNFQASLQLTKLFNLSPVDVNSKDYANGTVTVDDDGDPTDPQEVVALLRRERDELVAQAKKKTVAERKEHRREKKAGEVMLNQITQQSWEQRKTSLFALLGFLYMIQEDRKDVTKDIVDDVAQRMDALLAAPVKPTMRCPDSGETDRMWDFPTMVDIDNLYQAGVSTGELLEGIGEEGGYQINELITGQCPANTFIVFYAGGNSSRSRFVVCKDKKGKEEEVVILGELVIRITNKSPMCPHFGVNREGRICRCGGTALPVGVRYWEYVFPTI